MDIAIIGSVTTLAMLLSIVVCRISTRRSPRKWVALQVFTMIALALVYFGKLLGSETMWWVGLYIVVFVIIAAAWVAEREALDDSAPSRLLRFGSAYSRALAAKTLPLKMGNGQ